MNAIVNFLFGTRTRTAVTTAGGTLTTWELILKPLGRLARNKYDERKSKKKTGGK